MSSTQAISSQRVKPETFIDERTALTCIHCGLCLVACPTFLETGNENFSPRGRIYMMRQLQSGRVGLNPLSVRPLDLCLGCRGCESVCPSGVHYGQLLETTRDFVERKFDRSIFQFLLRRAFVEQVFPYPWRMKLALLPLKLLRALRLEGLLPKSLRDITALVPTGGPVVKLPEFSPATTAQKKGRVGMITGCVQSVLFSPTNAATVRLLNRIGYDVVIPPAQGCCGALYSHTGRLAKAREAARHNIAVFESIGLDLIISNAGGCGSSLKEYAHLLHDDPQWADRAKTFASKVRDLNQLLSAQPPSLITHHSSLVTYHDSCHLAHAQQIRQEPRALLKAVCGDRFVEMPESDMCCGSAGSYNLTEPKMAAQIQQRKIANILKTGAQIVVMANPGCILQIQAGLKDAGRGDIEVLHIADFLDRQSNGSK